jgi:two-component system response regulator
VTTPDIVDVLLVEDNPADVEMTMRALQRAHLANHIATVVDGADALDFLFATGPHADRAGAPPIKVVFLDLKLPKVSGLEVLERLKGDPRTRELPVVILTSSAEAPDVAAAYRLGANSYLVKPVDFEKFVESVSQAGLYWLLINKPPR